MVLRSRNLMGFRVPLPACCRGPGSGKRAAEVAAHPRDCGVVGPFEHCGDDRVLPPRTQACHRARGRQGQALRVAAKGRPSLTAARHGGAVELRSGRKNGFAEIELKNPTIGKFCAKILWSRYVRALIGCTSRSVLRITGCQPQFACSGSQLQQKTGRQLCAHPRRLGGQFSWLILRKLLAANISGSSSGNGTKYAVI
jgi:hypothetical protein